MNSKDYWRRRLLQLEDINEELTKAELAKQYKKSLNSLKVDLVKLSAELGPDAKPNDLYRYRNWYELQGKINNELVSLGNAEILIYDDKLKKTYEDTVELINKQYPWAAKIDSLDPKRAEKAIKAIWCSDGRHYSDRVWTHKAELQKKLQDEIMNVVIRGNSPDNMEKALMKEFGVSFSRAECITRTEISHVVNQASYDRYVDAGIEKYEVLSDQADDECLDLNGHIFNLVDAVEGENYPPFHPQCKCTVAPIVE